MRAEEVQKWRCVQSGALLLHDRITGFSRFVFELLVSPPLIEFLQHEGKGAGAALGLA
jgi:hypothetical protein